ncbi:MAG: hypothetical protein AAFY41_12275, partial [Bacteroidota bacterium]
QVLEGEDLSLSLIYQDTTVFNDIDEFIILDENISSSDDFTPFDVDIPAQPTENRFTAPTEIFDFEFNSQDGEKIDSTFFKGGSLSYTLTSDFDLEVDYILTLIDIRDLSNNPVIFENTLNEGEGSKSESIPLNGLKNVAERIGSSNIFNASLDLTFTIPAGTPINSSQEVRVDLIFEDTEFSAIFGDFESDSVEVQNDTIEFASLDELNEGGLFLKNPSVTLDFENFFGVELGISLDEVKSLNNGNTETMLMGEVVDELQFVDAPNELRLGEKVNSSFTIDITNSNIDELLNGTPDNILFSVSAIPNPPGADNIVNYMFDSSYLEIRTTMEIPLDFRMDGFSKDFDLEVSGNDLIGADSIVINAQILNDLPLDGSLDLSFRNESGTEIYSIPSISLIESPQIGSDGRTLSSAESRAIVRLDDAGIEAFLNTEEIIATVNVFTFDNESGTFVKIFSDYNLEIFLTASGTVEVEL